MDGAKSIKLDLGKLDYLQKLTLSVVDDSRIRPGVSLFDLQGGIQLQEQVTTMPCVNQTGITLIRPGGWACYPAFWIRDLAMSLDSDAVGLDELKAMIRLTASSQNGPEALRMDDAFVPAFAVPDHINLDGSPVYFPGTYSSGTDQGGGIWGRIPPYCDYFYFIEMVDYYVRKSGDSGFLNETIQGVTLIERLEQAFLVPEYEPSSGIVKTSLERRAVNFGFNDSIVQSGYLLFATLLKYRAALMLADLLPASGAAGSQNADYREIAEKIKQNLPTIFGDKSGWLIASTECGKQQDVWGTVYAVYLGLLEGSYLDQALQAIREGYLNGTTCYQGNVRHIPTTNDYSQTSAWEKTATDYPKNVYQNGAYWAAPVGWYAYALSEIEPELATELVEVYIAGIQGEDYRDLHGEGAPWECLHPEGEYRQNGVYMVSVALPYAVFKEMAV
ncbi:hypothetical protein [Paenibacillus eucommiae]|uniref:Uncharacterized protein n=1 Tax=Paenibacillus eucommiae TaxID=1355755 RepID=A0ABS4IRI8_9BACL|nr:hypothetical protein [Paenibacillus eucommiae]MBP1990173.1 hypothetical protein [Paenibacillus eucommiae]